MFLDNNIWELHLKFDISDDNYLFQRNKILATEGFAYLQSCLCKKGILTKSMEPQG